MHRAHPTEAHFEEGLLDYNCPACLEMRVGQLDELHLVRLLGLGRAQLELAIRENFPALMYPILNTLAVHVQAEALALEQTARQRAERPKAVVR